MTEQLVEKLVVGSEETYASRASDAATSTFQRLVAEFPGTITHKDDELIAADLPQELVSGVVRANNGGESAQQHLYCILIIHRLPSELAETATWSQHHPTFRSRGAATAAI